MLRYSLALSLGVSGSLLFFQPLPAGAVSPADAAPPSAIQVAAPIAVPAESGDAARSRAADLVRKLGDPSFAVRQQASRELNSLGSAAKGALISALKDPDEEVRFRAERILVGVLRADFQVRLDAFLADSDGRHSHDLPCWALFRQFAGNSLSARQMYAEAVRSESVLLETIEQDPRHASEAIAARCDSLLAALARQRPIPFRSVQTTRIPLSNMAALVLAASGRNVVIDETVGNQVYMLFYQSQMMEEMSGSRREPLRRLLGGWIGRNADTALAVQSMYLGIRFDLKEGLAPAQYLASHSDQPAYVRQLAILTIGKLGGREHVPVLEAFLSDATACDQLEQSHSTNRCEIRDVALAAIIHLHGRDPKDFGFSRIQKNSVTLFAQNSMGFAEERQRAAALAQWKTWLAGQPKQTARKPLTAG